MLYNLAPSCSAAVESSPTSVRDSSALRRAALAYALTQQWSRQLMIHAQARDGIRYHSRKNPRKVNYAIYDTTLAKETLRVLERRRLGDLPELYTILDNYEVALIG